MIFARDLLQTKTVGELRSTLVSMGANWHSKEKAPKLIDRIMELSLAVQPDQKLKEEQMQANRKYVPPVKPGPHSQEDVLKAVKPFTDRGLEAQFSPDGETWHFQRNKKVINRDGQTILVTKEDSGNMRIPLGNIKRCAEMVMGSSNLTDAVR